MRLAQRLLISLVFFGLSTQACVATICDSTHSCDPPTSYYNGTVSGGVILTGSDLKNALHTIISPSPPGGPTNPFPVMARNYDSARSSLQLTDADPNHPGNMLTVYDRGSIDLAAIVPNSNPPIYGWNSNGPWNREHTWPQSRGLEDLNGNGGTLSPDGSDLFLLRPANSSENSSRGNNNYGGAFGARTSTGGLYGNVTDKGATVWYPGDADAGMIAREEFYLAVRYDGSEANTRDLELASGNPAANNGTLLGDLDRLIEWNYAVVPDSFERNRNQLIYGSAGNLTDHALNPNYYQGNRDPFVDHPEWVWSVFVNQTNNSQIAISGASVGADGSSTKSVDLGRVFTGAVVPGTQSVTLNKAGLNGTYYSVTASGEATSTLAGNFNAFRTNQTDSKVFSVGLNTTTSTPGVKTGAVIIDNLDITTGGGAGHGAKDGNDTINVSLTVLNHAIASYSENINKRDETIDFGDVPIGSTSVGLGDSITNWGGLGSPAFAANLDLDSVQGTSGNLGAFDVGLTSFSNLTQNDHVNFFPTFSAGAIGHYSASYTLNLSDEDLPGAQNQTLTLTLIANVIATILAGDYNGDGIVDAADYTVWRDTLGQTVASAHDGADGDGDMMIGPNDYQVWIDNFGHTSDGPGAGASLGGSPAVPEPASLLLFAIGATVALGGAASRRSFLAAN
ncbi:MAG TPA: endonuclease [Lacipirellulaceae bacterium]|jgi:endonuclease I